MVLARTLKGKGDPPRWKGKDGWHGKPIKKGPDLDRALEVLEIAEGGWC